MAKADVFALRRSGLDAFLFASIGTEPSGTVLTVLSMFARLGDDPWTEAGNLVEASKGEAINKLAQTIAAMPRSSWTIHDATTIAERLVMLLPTTFENVASASSHADRPTVCTVGLVLLLGVLVLATAAASNVFSTPHGVKSDGSPVSLSSEAVTTKPPPE